jgi:Arc/MetJ-type ribon-helix-helix transcriptional regulator
MKVISVNLPEPYLEALADLERAGFYPSRSEAIRAAVRDLIQTDAGIKSGIQELARRNLGQ